MADGVMFTDREGRIVLANGALRSMLGATTDIVGRSPIEAIRNDELAELITRVRETGAASTIETEILGVTARQLRVRVAPLSGHGTDGVVAVLGDVTELRRLESLRRDFVANVSHELRTPLAAIFAATETLETAIADDPKTAQEFLGIITRQTNRLRELVEDVLKLSRVEAQKLVLVPGPLDVNEFLTDLFELHQVAATRHAVDLQCEPTTPPILIHVDRRAVEQILTNFVDNAIKYAPRSRVTLSAALVQDELHLRVADTGPGIAAKHLPRLFERFYRVDRGRSRDVGGTGLGLAIAKHFAEAMGARVVVESEVGRGATFSLVFPASVVMPHAPANA